jgi:2-iminoacetate synthase ThiH
LFLLAPAETKSEGWEYTMEEMLDIVKKYDGEPVTEVHIVGGVLPQYDVAFLPASCSANKSAQARICMSRH